MPVVVCDTCGASNRASAMFCSGCAGRLPGFAPSGPSALSSTLDVVGSSSPGPRESWAGVPPDWALPPGSSLRILPAERPAFWLRLGMVGLLMFAGFMAWFLYVTRKVELPAPGPAAGIAATVPPAAGPGAPAPAVELPELPPAATTTPTATATAAAPPAPAAVNAAAPAPEPARPRTATADARSSARASPAAPPNAASTVARTPRSRDDGSAAAAVERSLALARAEQASAAAPMADPGPPLAAGPGPQYEWARTPSRLAGDLGPPVIAGPGPLIDDSPRRAGPR